MNIEIAEIIVEYLKDRGRLKYKSTSNFTGSETQLYLYNNQEEKDKHIEEMKQDGWNYDEEKNHKEGLYITFYDKDNEISVLIAYFDRDTKSEILEWFKKNNIEE